LDYDPRGNGGDGRMRFSIRGEREQHDEFEDKEFTVDLPKGYKDQGTTFDRFGLKNSAKPGNALTMYLDDLEDHGRDEEFGKDPGWVGVGNADAYDRRDEGG